MDFDVITMNINENKWRILKIDFVPQYSILSSTTMSSQTLPLMHITANLEWIRIDQVEKIDQLSPHQYIDHHWREEQIVEPYNNNLKGL